MQHISLADLDVSRVGLGAMGMSAFYTGAGADEKESIRTIHRALELGITLIDTAEVYGPYINEQLVGRAIAGRRDDVVLATKFGLISHRQPGASELDDSPASMGVALEGSLRRLGTDHIDLYYQHRVDPGTPIEETIGALGELVAEGKIRHIGMSEAAPARSWDRTCASSTRSRRSPPKPVRRRPRWHWRGCWPRATTSPRSRGRSACHRSRRTRQPTPSPSPASSWNG
jgi:aryl-alcohol dehydrogenase-like predicted oxidoreductase